MRGALLFAFILVACDPTLCASDRCSSDMPCAPGLTCAFGQCVHRCATVDDCPPGAKHCIDPQNLAGFTMCVDGDGVPGQACEDDDTDASATT